VPTIIAFRYDNYRYEVGDIVTPRGDSFESLTEVEKKVETELRKMLPDGQNIRGGSVFAWESELVAKRVWPLSHKTYLYELEIDQADIRLRGDLNHYNNAKDAAKCCASFDHHLRAYCNGDPSPVNGNPRIELLFVKGKVLKRHE
jgi:hypothetical protein